uniref:Uncharacterized protein n=1 Tax=Megaselia scalaris TaxID=36166 RepID=T1GZF9_MEGSC
MKGYYDCIVDPTCSSCGSYLVTPLANLEIYNFQNNSFKKQYFKTTGNFGVKSLMINEFPRSEVYSTTEFFGYHMRILGAFSDYVNVTFGVIFSSKNHQKEKSFHVKIHSGLDSVVDFTMNFDVFMNS